MAARKKKHVEEEHENHERWLVSYADMVTLLMALFIVMFAMATVDQRKFAELADSLSGDDNPTQTVLTGSDGVLEAGRTQSLDTSEQAGQQTDFDVPRQSTVNGAAAAALKDQSTRERAQAQDQQNLEQVKEEIQASLDAKGLGDAVRFRREPKGLVVTIVTDRVLFDSGRADIKPGGTTILDALGRPLSLLPNTVTIEGHTDNQPIRSVQFPTNWELSTTRATSVLRYLADRGGVQASKLSASGYADQRSVVPNDTDEHRAQNRRVEVVVNALTFETAPLVDSQAAEQQDLTTELPTLPPKPQIALPTADSISGAQ